MRGFYDREVHSSMNSMLLNFGRMLSGFIFSRQFSNARHEFDADAH